MSSFTTALAVLALRATPREALQTGGCGALRKTEGLLRGRTLRGADTQAPGEHGAAQAGADTTRCLATVTCALEASILVMCFPGTITRGPSGLRCSSPSSEMRTSPTFKRMQFRLLSWHHSCPVIFLPSLTEIRTGVSMSSFITALAVVGVKPSSGASAPSPPSRCCSRASLQATSPLAMLPGALRARPARDHKQGGGRPRELE
eukprot:CAMPEP_0176191514 /NCGR_PEP_ID=MMETSP0121_2-20121125/4498_1 /TAXON_ID=160619 /ORGANISM="Kryptoperidinium foliaceum, Strain CCMP 1326" /LENGTH=203 /DNA_ID=CAMNT_0017530179 /DNA_START=300 /DNA_END=908 /DNA_ORIENTATION=-